MNEHLKKISDFIQQDTTISAEEKTALLNSVKDADRELEITSFKLDRTEKVKRTTAILLEETIEELEQKRKAVEAHNKELGIETALERVRTIAMSMSKPDDLLGICETMFHELKRLGFADMRNAMINIHYDDKNHLLNYDYSDAAGKTITRFDYKTHAIVDNLIYHAKQSRESFTEMIYSGENLQQWRTYRKENGEADDDRLDSTNALYYYFYSIDTGAIGISMFEPTNPEQLIVLKRFRNVFDLAYKRYVDITTAEAQARESQIQLALERVRARTMAMQHSNELAEASSVLFQQIKELGFKTWSCGFCIYTNNDVAELWMGADSGELLPPMMIPYKEERTHHDIYNALLEKQSSHQKIWSGNELEAHYEFLKTIPSAKAAIEQLEAAGQSLPDKQCYYVGFFKQGYLLLITKEPNDALEDLAKRFASVFDLTYTRFLDLKKAEAQSRESEIELALERVRARTMAMQRIDELADASFLLDSQVRALGIPTRGCVFNIYGDNESTEWFSSEMGTMPTYRTPREKLFLRYYEEGQKGKSIYIESFTGEACVAHYNYLMTIPIMGDGLKALKASGGSFPKQQFDHVVYFKYGYLLFITLEPAPEAHDIFIRFAKVFEQTYTRFLDLQKAEAQSLRAERDLVEIKLARQNAEDALTELRATQTQLIQSEKMASLGELTAGIAHEIQNPLNFVNNFSEVSNELIDEMMEEVAKGNFDEVKAIAGDVKQNLEKINHHGKRADGIVKGMLQHSRTASGQKEFTNINALADEYLRLAYHGIRAKDKNFNATLKTDFDASIGNINIVPQDIGRVILNLITNAFYTVNEKSKFKSQNLKDDAASYQPTVSITTKAFGSEISIEVNDNGNGIPSGIIDKIFQPFFTTKPTGQGTGLGLSLSYDIVNAHGGELKVETKAGTGSTFIIQIPVAL